MLTSLKQFSIIPNVHPILVHFTIATVSISFIFHTFYLLGSYRYKRSNLLNEIGVVARWCLWLAGLFSILTVLAGLHAYYTVLHDEAGHLAMQTHKNSAIISFVLILLATTISIGQYRRKSEPNYLLLLILFITQISVLTTGYLGGEVVYRYGIGVIKAQTPDMQLSHNHHHGNKSSEQHDGHDMSNMAGMDMSHMEMGHDHENHAEEHEMKPAQDNQNNTSNVKTPLYWIDPMEPAVHYAKPGKSAMGMELVPVYSKPKDDNQPKNSIKLPQGYVNNLGVVTVPVINSNITNQISTYAYVESDENKIAYVTSYTNGWVRNLVVKSTGTQVKKGQLLAQIYSPTIINAEQEYLMAMQSNNKLLADAAFKKLNTYHFSEVQIKQLQQTKTVSQLINIYAPQMGIISGLNVREGDYVTPETKLFNIVDLSSVWLIASVFEKQAQWLKIGNAAIAKFAAYPDKTWQGTVEYIYPQVDPQTRSLKARLRFDNPSLMLKPNMYGNITIATSPKLGKLSIPEEAVIRGTNGNRVIVALGNGVFRVRKITLGDETNGQIEVLSGLNSGESVVKSGEFMLDSEANLNSAVDKIDSPEGTLHD
jgi:membrane fusion protein, copper/silver efflux system